MYGLKQAYHQWNIKFASVMRAGGYRQSQHDHSLFTHIHDSIIILLIVYVDDIIITGNAMGEITKLKTFLHSKLLIRDMGLLHIFWGLKLLVLRMGFT